MNSISSNLVCICEASGKYAPPLILATELHGTDRLWNTQNLFSIKSVTHLRLHGQRRMTRAAYQRTKQHRLFSPLSRLKQEKTSPLTISLSVIGASRLVVNRFRDFECSKSAQRIDCAMLVAASNYSGRLREGEKKKRTVDRPPTDR